MLVPVLITRDETNAFFASAPDFPGCAAGGSELGRTITRIHLQLEGRVAEMLINGESLPVIGSLKVSGGNSRASDGQLYQIHINLVHLAAVARHQTRPRPDAS